MSRYNDPVESVWVDVGDAAIVPPEWVVTGLIPVGVTFLIGPPKSYKSLVELAAVLTVCGIPNTALPADLSTCEETGRVLMLSGEAQAGVLRHTAKEGIGVDIPNDMRFLAMENPWRFRLDQPDNVKELLGWAEELHATMLCIDPLRNFHSLDENDSGGMVMMLQPIQQWAIKNRRAVVIVHHSKKLGEDKESGKMRNATANDIRGTSALFGLADAVITVTAKSKTGLIHMDAILKRGEAWERTIQLGIWGMSGVETIDGEVKMLFELLKTGLTVDSVAKAMKLSTASLQNGLLSLRRLGALDSKNQPTANGAALVSGAVRKYAAKM